jgi:DNA-binding FadR family transcriptional regulator
MPLQTIASQRLYRQIAEQLRASIEAGEWQAGARLPAERDLAQQLGVSRPSVREALIALEVQGLVEVRTGSGVFVSAQAARVSRGRGASAEQSDWGPLALMQARLLVEAEVASLAARHAKPQHIKALTQAVRELRARARSNQPARAADEAFHLALSEAAGNEVLADTVRQYWQSRRSPLFERLGDHFESEATWTDAYNEHCAVLEAVRTKDAAGAKRAMRRHLTRATESYSISWAKAQPPLRAQPSQRRAA